MNNFSKTLSKIAKPYVQRSLEYEFQKTKNIWALPPDREEILFYAGETGCILYRNWLQLLVLTTRKIGKNKIYLNDTLFPQKRELYYKFWNAFRNTKNYLVISENEIFNIMKEFSKILLSKINQENEISLGMDLYINKYLNVENSSSKFVITYNPGK